MRLIDQLDGAELVVLDEDRRLLYAWFGGAGVNVYDEDGNEVHYFTIGTSAPRVSPAVARAAIARVRASAHTTDS
jgi:hypothetical protein